MIVRVFSESLDILTPKTPPPPPKPLTVILSGVNISKLSEKTLTITLIALLLIAAFSFVRVGASAYCWAYGEGTRAYAYVNAWITSDGYTGRGYAEVGKYDRKEIFFYGVYMRIWAQPNSGTIGLYYSYSTTLPEGYAPLEAWKPYVWDHSLYSYAEIHLGDIYGPLDASAGTGATIGGYCVK